MPTSSQLLEGALERLRAGQVPRLDGQGAITLSSARERVLRSQWLTTMDYVVDIEELDAGAESVEVGPYLARIDDYARRAATHAHLGRSTIASFVSNVLLLVRAAVGMAPGARRPERAPSIAAEDLSPAWASGLEVLQSAARHDVRVHSSYPSALGRLAKLARLHQCECPEDMPDDHALWKQRALAAGFSDSDFQYSLSAFRKARSLTGDGCAWPSLRAAANEGCRGVRSVPGLREKLAARGCSRDPRAMTLLEIIEVLAPYIHSDLVAYLEYGTPRNRASWPADQVAGVSRLLFALFALGIDPVDMDTVDLYVETVRTDVPVPARTRRSKRGGDAGNERPLSLARAAFDYMARLSVRQSYLAPRTDVPGPISFYTAVVQADETRLWLLTRHAHESVVSAADRETWLRCSLEREALVSTMRRHNAGLDLVGHMRKLALLDWITLPQAVLIGLPALRIAARAHRERWLDRGGVIGGPHFEEAAEAAFRWVLCTILLDDGLRIKNYTGALAGLHIKPVWNHACIVGLETTFHGIADEDRVRLKKARAEGTREENTRRRVISPALIDSEVLTFYWTTVRPWRLTQCGALSSLDAFDARSDRFAVFVSRRSNDVCDVDGVSRPTGRYDGTDDLSNAFGRAIHWVITEVLRRRDVPAWDSPRFKEECRGIMGAHRIVRLLSGSFWGFEAGDWDYASWITNDTMKTLRAHYAAMSTAQRQALAEGRKGLDAPGHFVKAMLHIRHGGAVDWERFNPLRPDDALMMDAPRRRRA